MKRLKYLRIVGQTFQVCFYLLFLIFQSTLLEAVLISEFSAESVVSAGGVYNDWIELYNPTNTSFDFVNSSWSVQVRTVNTYKKLDLTGAISAWGFYLIVRDTTSTNEELKDKADQLWPELNLTHGKRTIYLVNNSVLLTTTTDTGSSVVDRVAHGTGDITPEGTPLSGGAGSDSFERKAFFSSTAESMGGEEEFYGNAFDSDDNSSDFVRRTDEGAEIEGIPGTPQGTVDGCEAIPSPQNFSGVAISTVGIRWVWEIIRGATYYIISNVDTNSNLVSVTTGYWIEENLTPNTTYDRCVKTGVGKFYSDESSSYPTVTLACPPYDLSVLDVSSTTVTLSWSDSGATSYKVYIATDSIGPWNSEETPTRLSQTIKNLQAYSTYWFRLSALNIDGIENTAQYSNTVSTRTNFSASNRPTGFTGEAISSTTIRWSWDETKLSDGYYLKKADDNVVIATITNATITSYVQTNFSPNTEVGNYLVAYNEFGESPPTDVVFRYTRANPPDEISFTDVSDGSITINWASNNNPSYTRYGLAFSTDAFSCSISTFVYLSDNLTLNRTSIFNLLPDTSYYFVIWAYNNKSPVNDETVIISDYSNVVSTKTKKSSSVVYGIPICVLTKPSPYRLSSGKPLVFWGSNVAPDRTKIRIYTLSGDLVTTIEETYEESSGNYVLHWNGTTPSGQKVVPGIYFYTVDSPKARNRGKIIVVK